MTWYQGGRPNNALLNKQICKLLELHKRSHTIKEYINSLYTPYTK